MEENKAPKAELVKDDVLDQVVGGTDLSYWTYSKYPTPRYHVGQHVYYSETGILPSHPDVYKVWEIRRYQKNNLWHLEYNIYYTNDKGSIKHYIAIEPQLFGAP